MGMMKKLMRLMAEKKASDLYLSAHAPVLIKVDGVCSPVTSDLLPNEAPHQLLAEVVSPEQLSEFEHSGELNIAVPLSGVGRFRLSAMRQRSNCAVVVRFISIDIPPLESLGIPPVLADMIMAKRGLMLVVGATGSGKSTTLASLLDHRNGRMPGHILTIEDPVEFLFQNKQSIVNQREVGADTASLHMALKNALRQAPDVILIGEIRDRETMSAAIAYSQSGHLVLATLRANNSYQALNRILNFYPAEVRPTMLNDLASALKVIVSQRLLRTLDGRGLADLRGRPRAAGDLGPGRARRGAGLRRLAHQPDVAAGQCRLAAATCHGVRRERTAAGDLLHRFQARRQALTPAPTIFRNPP